MKMKLISLGLAAALALSLAGCNMATPASVGTIGDVEITAGLYLLTQYNNYSRVSGAVELATGESASNVKLVLDKTATGTVGDEEFTGTGAEYLAKLVARDLDHYAAVETAFAALGGALSDEDLAAIKENTDSTWESNGELYAANGIGKESLEMYTANTYKEQALLDLYYGPDGAEPVGDDELTSFISDDCLYMEGVELPLLNYSTFTFADDEQTEAVNAIAEECMRALTADAPEGADAGTVTAALQSAAAEYVPQAFAALDSSIDESLAPYYVIQDLVLPDEVASYTLADGSNALQDTFGAAGMDKWTVVDLTSSLLAARQTDPLAAHTAAELCEQYAVLDALRGEDLQARLYADGAALPHALDQSAMNTYKPGNIKRSV